jgi:hypothetical protein
MLKRYNYLAVLAAAISSSATIATTAAAVESWNLSASWVVAYQSCKDHHFLDLNRGILCRKYAPKVRCIALARDGAFIATSYEIDSGKIVISGHGTGGYELGRDMDFVTPCNVKKELYTTPID